MKRYSEFYLTETIKQYMAGDRRQRQWIAMAAKEQHITPTLEGGLDFKKNMTEAMDGYAGIEHTLPIAPMYKDAIELFAKSGTTWTPTLLVQYGGPWAENWWYEHYDILSDAEAHALHAVHGARAPRAASPAVVPRQRVLVQAVRRAGEEGRGGGRPRGTRRPRSAAGTRRALGDVEHRERRHEADGRAARRDDLWRRVDRARQADRHAGEREAGGPASCWTRIRSTTSRTRTRSAS